MLYFAADWLYTLYLYLCYSLLFFRLSFRPWLHSSILTPAPPPFVKQWILGIPHSHIVFQIQSLKRGVVFSAKEIVSKFMHLECVRSSLLFSQRFIILVLIFLCLKKFRFENKNFFSLNCHPQLPPSWLVQNGNCVLNESMSERCVCVLSTLVP